MGDLHAEVERLERLLADSDLYARDPVAFASASQALSAARGELSQSEDSWLTLEERRECLARGGGATAGN